VVPLPAGWLLTGGISATADDRTFFAAAFSAKSCPVQARAGGISPAAHETRFFRFAVNEQGRAGRLTVVGPPVSGIVGPIAVSPDGSRIAFNAADGNFVGPGKVCAGGEAEGAAIRVVDLATGRIRTWQSVEMPPAPAGTGVTPGAVSWMADGRTLAVGYVWPTSESGPQLSMAVAALDTTSGGGSLQAHSRVLWSQPQKCVFCVQEALISPDGKSLTAIAIQHTAHGYRNVLLRIAVPSGRYRVLYESPAEEPSVHHLHPGRLGSARHRGVRRPGGLDQGRQAGPPGSTRQRAAVLPRNHHHRLVIRFRSRAWTRPLPR